MPTRARPVRYYRRDELDVIDPTAVHDDDESTDHLGRLRDPDVLVRVITLDRDIERDANRVGRHRLSR
jgi:hypothetical protein